MNRIEAKNLVIAEDKETTYELYLPEFVKSEVSIKMSPTHLIVKTADMTGLRDVIQQGFENKFRLYSSDATPKKNDRFLTKNIKAEMNGFYLLITIPIAEKYHSTEIEIA
jgi:hypothetical protein